MYHIYIICSNEKAFKDKANYLRENENEKIADIIYIPAVYHKITDNNLELLDNLKVMYNTDIKKKIGKKGCISAHLLALISILNNKSQNNIILEEDAVFTNRLPSPPEFSSYMGGWIINKLIKDIKKPVISTDLNLIDNQLIDIDYSKYRILQTHSLFIKYRDVKSLIDTIYDKKIKSYDIHLSEIQFFKKYYYPQIFKQEQHISTIDNSKTHSYDNYNIKFHHIFPHQ